MLIIKARSNSFYIYEKGEGAVSLCFGLSFDEPGEAVKIGNKFWQTGCFKQYFIFVLKNELRFILSL
jgi:hypothetical protein